MIRKGSSCISELSLLSCQCQDVGTGNLLIIIMTPARVKKSLVLLQTFQFFFKITITIFGNSRLI